jgi:hypothetical protein
MDELWTKEAVWQTIDHQGLSVAELLAQLSDDPRRQLSLCTGWTVRDVAGQVPARRH